VCLPNFNVFGNLGRNLINEKLKGGLIASVSMISKCVMGFPCLYLDKRHCLSAKSTLPISITELCWKLPHGASLTLSHKLWAYVLCHKSPKDISPRIGYHNKERLKLVYTYAQYDRELLEPDIDIRESANQTFSSRNTGPQRRVAHMGHDHKTDAIFFDLYYEVFPKQKWKCFRDENKIFWNENVLFRKHLRNASVFETKVKLFLFLKQKGFNLQTEVEVFLKGK